LFNKQSVSKALSRVRHNTIKLAIPLFFIITIVTLYYFEPKTLENSWKGRAPYIIFLGLLVLELSVAWKKIIAKKFTAIRVTALIISLMAPILYILAFFLGDLKSNVIELAKVLSAYTGLENRVEAFILPYWIQQHWTISLEYVVLSAFFTLSIWLMYGFDGIKKTSISLLFIWATTTFFMIDTIYPYGTFAILQSLSPFTTYCAASTLNVFGYNVRFRGSLLYDPNVRSQRFPNIGVNWPCAGVHSFIIYSIVILLFLKNIKFKPLELPAYIEKKLNSFIHRKLPTWFFRSVTLSYGFFKTKIVFIIIFIVGAIGTFLVNILRIVSIVVIMIKYGPDWAILFHSYYGELYFMAWILIYPSVIVYGSRVGAYLAKMKSKIATR